MSSELCYEMEVRISHAPLFWEGNSVKMEGRVSCTDIRERGM